MRASISTSCAEEHKRNECWMKRRRERGEREVQLCLVDERTAQETTSKWGRPARSANLKSFIMTTLTFIIIFWRYQRNIGAHRRSKERIKSLLQIKLCRWEQQQQTRHPIAAWPTAPEEEEEHTVYIHNKGGGHTDATIPPCPTYRVCVCVFFVWLSLPPGREQSKHIPKSLRLESGSDWAYQPQRAESQRGGSGSHLHGRTHRFKGLRCLQSCDVYETFSHTH